MEEIKIDIQDIEEAYNYILQAMKDIEDIEGLDEVYNDLNNLSYVVSAKKDELEEKLEYLEEEAYYEENKEKLKKEKAYEEYEYWKSQF